MRLDPLWLLDKADRAIDVAAIVSLVHYPEAFGSAGRLLGGWVAAAMLIGFARGCIVAERRLRSERGA